MALVVTTKGSSSPAAADRYYEPKPPPPPPLHKTTTTTAPSYGYSYNGPAAAAATTPFPPPGQGDDEHRALDGIVLALRGAAALLAFVAAALVASCRHGDWMEFGRYHEYRYLLGACVVASVYAAAQALRNYRRMRAGTTSSSGGLLLDFAGDQVVAYLLMTASSAALPITIRMRSAVINIFTDAMTAAISLAFIAFAALAFSAMLSAFRRRPSY